MFFPHGLYQDFRFKIKTTLIYIAGLLVLFTAVRVGILCAYYPVFAPLGTSEILWGFLRGVQFDASITQV